ncbi:RNA polymerase sigma factor [Flagellimonas sp. CMM7]|uniref:RNA polymerase sigma factor n=1 Tax=Flagellimonas sp. CMM7 TaxID=2654676 RepID=UPI0013D86F84|nr:sigma-70 family RNA polymerase sigma factor [Flagellimonas sp. CMM7]UII79085.1 sigma-70 family RNA polymerase sigma factor [Flagellimonas sp. CMM7]
MSNSSLTQSHELTTHFFRNEYGKLVAVITGYLGSENVETAEDIVQEALLKATEHWEMRGIPENPKAWLYTTAKNITLNILKRKKYQREYANTIQRSGLDETFSFSEEIIEDSQLKMMFSCCHPSISENSQIALILKILSGFSIAEIATAFFSNEQTISKRLVRGRKQMRTISIDLNSKNVVEERLDSVLKTIYLIFTEGYFPSHKNNVIRFDLCLEAIRLVKLLTESTNITNKTECYALLALMYFNISRFNSRISEDGEIIDLKEQDRSKWDAQLIQTGTQYLDRIIQGDTINKYSILATISANHCISSSYEKTNWPQILSLYDQLLLLEDSPIVHLNRIVAFSEVEGDEKAIDELFQLEARSDIANYYLYHFTMAELYKKSSQLKKAQTCYKQALHLASNERDKELLQKKINTLVLIPPSQLS